MEDLGFSRLVGPHLSPLLYYPPEFALTYFTGCAPQVVKGKPRGVVGEPMKLTPRCDSRVFLHAAAGALNPSDSLENAYATPLDLDRPRPILGMVATA